MTFHDNVQFSKASTTGKDVDPRGVNHPSHYNSHPSGVECIDIVRHHNFNVGNTIKYLWRAGLKVDKDLDARESEIKDVEKAIFYLMDELQRLKGEHSKEFLAKSQEPIYVVRVDGDISPEQVEEIRQANRQAFKDELRAELPKCPTPDCPGDVRYSAPGRGHLINCQHPKGYTATRVSFKND